MISVKRILGWLFQLIGYSVAVALVLHASSYLLTFCYDAIEKKFVYSGGFPLLIIGPLLGLEIYLWVRIDPRYYQYGLGIKNKTWSCASDFEIVKDRLISIFNSAQYKFKVLDQNFFFRPAKSNLTRWNLKIQTYGSETKLNLHGFQDSFCSFVWLGIVLFTLYTPNDFIWDNAAAFWIALAIFILPLACSCVWVILDRKKIAAFIKQLHQLGAMICPRCEYDLLESEDNHFCPQCKLSLKLCSYCGYDCHGIDNQKCCPECGNDLVLS